MANDPCLSHKHISSWSHEGRKYLDWIREKTEGTQVLILNKRAYEEFKTIAKEEGDKPRSIVDMENKIIEDFEESSIVLDSAERYI